jgi:hypothetical protein
MPRLVDLVVLDLEENDLFLDAERSCGRRRPVPRRRSRGCGIAMVTRRSGIRTCGRRAVPAADSRFSQLERRDGFDPVISLGPVIAAVGGAASTIAVGRLRPPHVDRRSC